MDGSKREQIFLREVGQSLPESVYDWLHDETDFFTAPASTKYHGNYPGGLFDHSHETAKALRWLTDKLGLHWERDKSPEIIGFFHDACKFNCYECDDVYTTSYRYRDDDPFPGHGEKSLLVLLPHLQLTQEEIMCIRYHMGAYEKNEWEYYDKAIRKYPNVLYTHTADMIASKVVGI